MDYKSRLPGLTGDMEQDLRSVLDYAVQGFQETRYYLNNLELSNFNDKEWDNIQTDLVSVNAAQIKVVAGYLELELNQTADNIRKDYKQADTELAVKISASAEGLNAEFTKQIGAVDKKVDGVSGSVTDLGTTLRGEISSSATDLTAAFTKADTKLGEDLRGEFKVTADSVSSIITNIGKDGKVTSTSIIQSINGDTSGIQLKADNIDLTGYVSIKAIGKPGGVEIDGGNIKAGTIEGVEFISKDPNGDGKLTLNEGFIGFGENSDTFIKYLGSYGLRVWAEGNIDLQCPQQGSVFISEERTNNYFEFDFRYGKLYLHQGNNVSEAQFNPI